VKIQFLETYQVKDQEGKIYREGEIYDLPEPSARHFLRKSRAKICLEAEKAEIIEEPSPPESLEKELGNSSDPVKAFTEGQRKYRKKKLSSDDEDE